MNSSDDLEILERSFDRDLEAPPPFRFGDRRRSEDVGVLRDTALLCRFTSELALCCVLESEEECTRSRNSGSWMFVIRAPRREQPCEARASNPRRPGQRRRRWRDTRPLTPRGCVCIGRP